MAWHMHVTVLAITLSIMEWRMGHEVSRVIIVLASLKLRLSIEPVASNVAVA